MIVIQCQENPRIVEVLHFSELLESCRFQEFWVRENECLNNPILMIDLGKIERYCGEYSRFSRSYSRVFVEHFFLSSSLTPFNCLVICQTINRTYQTIDRQELQLALGRLIDSEFEKLIKTRGWKTATDDSNYIWIANHEENIKSRNIVEKIKFERELIFVFPESNLFLFYLL